MKSAYSVKELTVIVCVALVVMQAVYFVVPSGSALRLYNMALRPLVYAVLAAAVFAFMGLNGRPVRKAFASNMVAVISVLMFGATLLIVSYMFGAGANVMLPVAARNLWEVGSLVILGELIRYKLIKGASEQERTAIIIALTITLALSHMTAIRMLIDGETALGGAIFFEVIFKHLVISAVVSYFAIEGSFPSVLLISFVYIMAPHLLPIIPDISPLVWTLVTCGVVFLTAVVYRFITNDKRRALRLREKRVARYAKKPILANLITAGVIAVIIAFFAGAFPIYPVVILTGSMTGTLDRGSLVFVERVPEGEAYIMVGEGYVIHFLSRGRVEYIHRVIDFTFDAYGDRQYITQGDANERPDSSPVSQEDVLGISRAQIPYLGYPYILFRAITAAFG